MSLLRTLLHGNRYWKQLLSLHLSFFFVHFKERLCRITEYILLSNDGLLGFYTMQYNGFVLCFRGKCYSIFIVTEFGLGGCFNIHLSHLKIYTSSSFCISFLILEGILLHIGTGICKLSQILKGKKERKTERDLFTFIQNFTIFTSSLSLYTTTLNVCLLSSSSVFLILLK